MRIDSSGNVGIGTSSPAATLDVNGTIKLDGNYPVGTGNVALGDAALDSLTTGTRNTALGDKAGTGITSGNGNVAVGDNTMTDAVTGADNTAVGTYSLNLNTSGTLNTAVGGSSLERNTTGSYNTAVGRQALTSNTTASYNTAVGYHSLYSNTTGIDNTAVGFNTLDANTTGHSNVAIGGGAAYQAAALNAVTTGYNNVGVGSGAGSVLTTAANCTMVGRLSGYDTTGGNNTFIGESAGYLMTSGASNTILGRYSGNQGGLDIRTSNNNIVLSDGDGNVRAHWNSSGSMTTSTSATGNYALAVNSTGSTGYPLLVQYTTASPNDTTYRFLTCRDTSTPSTGRMYVYSNGNVVNTNNSYGAVSDVKLKENIVDASSQWDDIKALTVRKYSMKDDNLDAPNMLGVIAQEVEEAGMAGLVFESPDTDADNNDLGTVTKQVNYSILYMKAVKALQEAMDRIETLEAKVTALEAN
jgi:hypothetical protein